MIDAFDRELEVGDFVVYGQALGRSAGLSVARVTAVDHKTVSVDAVQGWKYLAKTKLRFSSRLVRINYEDLPTRLKVLFEE